MRKEIVFDREAACWEEALPIGNGRLGAMVYGGVWRNQLQLNEDSIWYGKPVDRINPDALSNLEKVRSLIFGGKPREAEELLRYAFSAVPQSQRIYQPLADCFIQMKEKQEVRDYFRVLDLREAVVKDGYRTSGGGVRREYFASAPAQVIAVSMRAEGEERLSFDVLLTRQKMYDEMVTTENDSVYLTGNLGMGGLDFAAGCRVCAQGGTVRRIGEHIVVRDAASAVIYLAGSSTWYDWDPLDAVRMKLKRASKIPYGELRREHTEDYGRLFGRVELRLPEKPDTARLTTAQRLRRAAAGERDGALYALYFDFGRYLLISSSRPGCLAANLQGIWNHRMMPPWESKYTININIEMNYWMAESCGLAECMEPVFDLLVRMCENGRKTAKEMYGCRGFVAHHNTDIWADTLPQDIYVPATYWVMGGAWMSLFLWRHYEYCGDREWLRRYFPILEDAVLFFLDFLVEDHGEYVTCPSVSPENTYITEDGVHASVCAGPAMDSEILYDLFTAYLDAARLLGQDGETAKQAKRILEKLPPIRVGKYGQIMEWRKDYEEAEPGHRHISQLYALYPSGQITVDGTPELAEAARRTLERRLSFGGGHTGWSCAWIIDLYAHLGMGEEALGMLDNLFAQSTFDNLMDNHPHVGGPVFQIDGNLGGCDAILQMLVQDDGKRVLLLPACPGEWDEGSIKGVRLKGNASLDLEWTPERVRATVLAELPWHGRLCCRGRETALSLERGMSFCWETGGSDAP